MPLHTIYIITQCKDIKYNKLDLHYQITLCADNFKYL